MDSDNLVTAAVGVLGIITTAGISIFSQVFQSRTQARRDEKSREARIADHRKQEMADVYRRTIQAIENMSVLYRGLGRDELTERIKRQSESVFSGTHIHSEVLLIGSENVLNALREHDRCGAARNLAWRDYWEARIEGDATRVQLLMLKDELRQANYLEGRARYLLLNQIRSELREDVED